MDGIGCCRDDNLISYFPTGLDSEYKQAGSCFCGLIQMGPRHIAGLSMQIQTPKHT